jgi:hypothetical protein
MIRPHLLIVSAAALLGVTVDAETPQDDLVQLGNGVRYSASAYQAGREEAEKDLRDNRWIVEWYGKIPAWNSEYAKLLEERYHIQLRTVAGCIVDDKIVGHARGYNEISLPVIKRQFGADVLERTQTEASEHWRAARIK